MSKRGRYAVGAGGKQAIADSMPKMAAYRRKKAARTDACSCGGKILRGVCSKEVAK